MWKLLHQNINIKVIQELKIVLDTCEKLGFLLEKKYIWKKKIFMIEPNKDLKDSMSI